MGSAPRGWQQAGESVCQPGFAGTRLARDQDRNRPASLDRGAHSVKRPQTAGDDPRTVTASWPRCRFNPLALISLHR
jgi:hypothetical protein